MKLIQQGILVGFLVGASANAVALPESNTIEFSNCSLSSPGSPRTASARCGFIDVPENPQNPDGKQISLHVAIAEATSQDAAQDPVFFFAGGPGQAATETWTTVRNSLRKIRKSRDIVMIDQRGTGQSNKLQCTPENEQDLNAEIDFEEIARETERCAGQLEADTTQYTTTIAMHDYNRVREAMGYDKINLIGVSYGTRAAQVYLRLFPETVRTVTLDSVVPMQLALGQEHAPMLDQAVNNVLADCEREKSCSELFPNPASQLEGLMQDLRAEPRQIIMTNPVTGLDEEVRLSAESLAVAIRFLSYSSETQALLPLLLHEAINNNELERLASQAVMVMTGLNEMIARGMELSVMCSEDYPFIDVNANYSDTIIGNIMLQAIEAQCSSWPRGEIPEGFHDPVVSDVPVLLLSGERDPVTPPQYASQAAATFSNHVNLVARGQSHSVLRLVCFQEIATEFVTNGSVTDLDSSCADEIRPSPFFTSLLGPNP